MTYNHSSYIVDAMNGFCMQKTSFPYVNVIVDDASTDGEPEVIEQYLQENFNMDDSAVVRREETNDYRLVYAQHKTNKNCYFVVLYLKYNHYLKKDKQPYYAKWINSSKYVAICEGDDYWTDPYKLQKQVDFLESHPDYSMCFHAAKISLEGVDASITGAKCESLVTREYFANDMFASWIVPTASIVYRKQMLDTFSLKNSRWLTRGDIALVLRCSHVGRVWGMEDQMSVYRMQPSSVSHNPAIRGKEIFKLPNHFRCLYINFPELNKADITWCISHAYYGRMKKQRNPFKFIRDFYLFVYWDPRYAFHKILQVIGFK